MQSATELEASPVAPSLKPEPVDANELPRVVGYDFKSPPQSTSREQQIMNSSGIASLSKLARSSPHTPHFHSIIPSYTGGIKR